MLKEYLVKDIPKLKIHGRTTTCREPLTLFWTASGFECNVSGTELSVEVEVSYDTFEPWISYTVNGDWVGRQMLVKGRYWIPLFRGMSPDKIKNVRFYKDLQAMSDDGNSYIHIHALRLDGTFYPVEEKKLKLEFIGDSITSGEGLFGAREEEDWIPMFFSSLRDYACLTAKKLDAEYRVFSQSGWGVLSAWDNNVNGALPKHYREICSLQPGEKNERLGGNAAHDFTSWQPDYVIVNLGTNDASAFEQPEWIDEKTGRHYKMHKNSDGSYLKEDIEAFQTAVKDFLGIIRACNPKAHIIWCYGMLGLNLQMSICRAVFEYIDETEDRAVSYLQLPNMNESTVGSRSHPGYLCHMQAAEVLCQYIGDLIAKKGRFYSD
ncbi:MAG: SGNH/GDSL hydrolase family protein [Lachnospiraceae bacterium]|nr:SGNH/GDSL hydrolase family protein [Lachnospiraceae bacterium]